MENDKHIDESWKDSVSKEKDAGHEHGENCGCSENQEIEVSFMNYIMSLGYQAMIFLGEVPHPMSGQIEKNVRQAKFLIDTLLLLKEKTRGNLTPEEDSLLGSSLYELQMKYVEAANKEKIA